VIWISKAKLSPKIQKKTQIKGKINNTSNVNEKKSGYPDIGINCNRISGETEIIFYHSDQCTEEEKVVSVKTENALPHNNQTTHTGHSDGLNSRK
jgi:hypothetical protein